MSNGIVIVIDPGHGGSDPGAVGSNVAEKAVNLAVGWSVTRLLIAQGYDAHMTRTTDKAVELSSRTGFANVLEAALTVSIHCNASTAEAANGVETWHYPTDKIGGQVASRIQAKVVEATGWRDRGVKTSRQFWMLRKTKGPAVIVECGFVSNVAEGAQLADANYQEAIAGAIAGAINEVMRGVS